MPKLFALTLLALAICLTVINKSAADTPYDRTAANRALSYPNDQIPFSCTPELLGKSWDSARARYECLLQQDKHIYRDNPDLFDAYAAKVRRLAAEVDAGKLPYRQLRLRYAQLDDALANASNVEDGEREFQKSGRINYAGLTQDLPWPDDAPGTRSVPMPYDLNEERYAIDDMDEASRMCIRRAKYMTRHAQSECFLRAYRFFVIDIKLRDMKLFEKLVAAERLHDTARVTLDANNEAKSDHFDKLFAGFNERLDQQIEQSVNSVRPYDPSALPRAEIARDQAIRQCPPAKRGALGAHYQCMLLADKAYAHQIKAPGGYWTLVDSTFDAAELARTGKITAAEMERRYQAALTAYHDQLPRNMAAYQCWKTSHDVNNCWKLSRPVPAASAHP